jgi:hypothetical protein
LQLWLWRAILLFVNQINELPITIRLAYPDDLAALRQLASLDSSTVPAEPLLVAEVDGQLRVAVSMADLRAIADPFVPTALVVELIRQHIKRVNESSRRHRLLRKVTPALSPHLA